MRVFAMLPLLSYFLCLAVLTPALSLDVFFSLFSKAPRQHDLLSIFAMLLQLLATVTSPVKIALTLAVFCLAFAARHTVNALKPEPAVWHAEGI
jgi:hypothetical protein